MTILVSKILAATASLAVLVGTLVAMQLPDLSLGSAPSGLAAKQTIATTTAVGNQEVITVFSNKAQCSSRVISTTDGTGQAIQVMFGTTGNDLTPTEALGHLQAASTTVMYDAGLYGCGAWKVFASASTTLLIAEFN